MEPNFELEKLLYALGLAAVIGAMATRAHADVAVSQAAMPNVACEAAHCTATAAVAGRRR